MNEYEELKATVAKEFRNMSRGQPGPHILDENGIDMTNSYYGKRHTEEFKEERSINQTGAGNYNWKGGVCNDMKKYKQEWFARKKLNAS